ncbi:hypothetical protein KCU77_g7, partial [Aureobasidium melanogenum]
LIAGRKGTSCYDVLSTFVGFSPSTARYHERSSNAGNAADAVITKQVDCVIIQISQMHGQFMHQDLRHTRKDLGKIEAPSGCAHVSTSKAIFHRTLSSSSRDPITNPLLDYERKEKSNQQDQHFPPTKTPRHT